MFLRLFLATLTVTTMPFAAFAQSEGVAEPGLTLELNAALDVGNACRLTFLISNETGQAIDKAVFETVIFDLDGAVVNLSLFDFRDLPQDRPRVRQFDLPERTCGSVGRVLINGANSCVVNGSENEICDAALLVRSRLDMELLG